MDIINNINRAIIEVETLHKLLCKTASCGGGGGGGGGGCGQLSETRWQIEKQGNIVHECLNSLNSSLQSHSPPLLSMNGGDDLCAHKEQSDVELHYDIRYSDKDKRARNVIRLIDSICVDVLNAITGLRYNFNNLSKTQKQVLSSEIIDNISEVFETRIKKHADKLKEIGLSERHARELNDITEKRLLQMISVYTDLYAQNREREREKKKTRNTRNSQRVRKKHIVKLRKDIQNRKDNINKEKLRET